MKKLLLSLLLAAGFASFCGIGKATAIPVFYSSGPEFSKIANLPDSVTIDGHHVNFGVAFNEFSIMWIPMWTWGKPEYAAIARDGKQAWSLDEEDVAYLGEEYGIDVSRSPSIPFWHKIGGKLIWAALILAIVWSYRRNRKDKEEGMIAGPAAQNQPQGPPAGQTPAGE